MSSAVVFVSMSVSETLMRETLILPWVNIGHVLYFAWYKLVFTY